MDLHTTLHVTPLRENLRMLQQAADIPETVLPPLAKRMFVLVPTSSPWRFCGYALLQHVGKTYVKFPA